MARRSKALPPLLLPVVAAGLAATPVLPAAQAAAAPTRPHSSSAPHLTDPGAYVVTRPGPGRFPLVAGGHPAPLVVDRSDYPGVRRVVGDLRSDVHRVTGKTPVVSTGRVPKAATVVVVGTLGHSPLVDGLARAGRIDASGIAGKWETSLEQVVDHPWPGVSQALVIAGSDQRGTIYGTYDVSRGIGVSPWYWFDDVAPQHRNALYVLPGAHTQGTPAVKYRGFFINDENPQTGEWAPLYFGAGKAPGYPGGLNSRYYAKVFETALRLKANYFWPAVWGRAFAEDDPQNEATAKKFGMVIGTSHEAPMARGIEEWNRHVMPAQRDAQGNITQPGSDPYGGTGEWSFRRNKPALEAYWRQGIDRMRNKSLEEVVTLGMRGNGDVALPDGEGSDLMSSIIADERRILAQETGKDVTTIPQVWTLYKEVQRYWDEGLRPPNDVTVVFTDDNWGNMRELPDPTMPKRAGGYGMYYHFDYVGLGRNYKWVDTANITNTWEQLHLTYTKGVDRLWMANVGDLKGNELPTQFYLDYAWSPNRWPVSQIDDWERMYAAENFGTTYAKRIASVLNRYSQLQSRRKPELLNRKITVDPTKDLATDSAAVVYNDQADPFSLTDYREHERVTTDWIRLARQADAIKARVPAAQQDAFYELVYYEVKATENLYRLRLAEFTNILYAKQGRALTNALARETDARFAEDQAMSAYFNNQVAGGKWTYWQSQPKIDYGDVGRYGPNAPWQQPELNNVALSDKIFPAVRRISLPDKAELGVAVDGSENWWPQASGTPTLPEFSPYQSQPSQYVDLFNRGSKAFSYSATSAQPWFLVLQPRGQVGEQKRLTFRVDWSRAPQGTTTVPVTVRGSEGTTVVVNAVVANPTLRPSTGFVEANGYVSMLADHATRVVSQGATGWLRLPNIGRDGSGMTPWPANSPRVTPGGASPRLEYDTTLFSSGPVQVNVYLTPRNSVFPDKHLRYAVSIDGEAPQVVDVLKATGSDDLTMNMQFQRNTSDAVNITTTTHAVSTPGAHTVKVWMVDPTVIVDKIVVDTGGLKPSYLGPPESRLARAS